MKILDDCNLVRVGDVFVDKSGCRRRVICVDRENLTGSTFDASGSNEFMIEHARRYYIEHAVENGWVLVRYYKKCFIFDNIELDIKRQPETGKPVSFEYYKAYNICRNTNCQVIEVEE